MTTENGKISWFDGAYGMLRSSNKHYLFEKKEWKGKNGQPQGNVSFKTDDTYIKSMYGNIYLAKKVKKTKDVPTISGQKQKRTLKLDYTLGRTSYFPENYEIPKKNEINKPMYQYDLKDAYKFDGMHKADRFIDLIFNEGGKGESAKEAAKKGEKMVPKILIAGKVKGDGWGDIVLTKKVAESIKSRYPKAVITVVVPEDGGEKEKHETVTLQVLGLFSKGKTKFGLDTWHEGIHYMTIPTLEKNAEYQEHDILITVPTKNGSGHFKFLHKKVKASFNVEECSFLNRNFKFGWGPDPTKAPHLETMHPKHYISVGFNSIDSGVAYSEIPKKKLSALSDSCQSFKKFIQADNYENLNRRLYFSYGHKWQVFRGFLHLVLAVEYKFKMSNNTVDAVDIVIPANEVLRRNNADDEKKSIEELLGGNHDKALEAKIKKLGAKFCYLDFKGQPVEAEKKKKKNEMKKEGFIINIINMPFFPNEDFKTISTASEPLAVCTGDQSLIECMSIGKPFIYEILAHKKSLYDDVLALVGVIDDSENQAAFNFMESCANYLPFLNKGQRPFEQKAEQMLGDESQINDPFFDDLADILVTNEGVWNASVLKTFQKLPKLIETQYKVKDRLGGKITRLFYESQLEKLDQNSIGPVGVLFKKALKDKEDEILSMIKHPDDCKNKRENLQKSLEHLYHLVHAEEAAVYIGDLELINGGGMIYKVLRPNNIMDKLNNALKSDSNDMQLLSIVSTGRRFNNYPPYYSSNFSSTKRRTTTSNTAEQNQARRREEVRRYVEYLRWKHEQQKRHQIQISNTRYRYSQSSTSNTTIGVNRRNVINSNGNQGNISRRRRPNYPTSNTARGRRMINEIQNEIRNEEINFGNTYDVDEEFWC